MPIGGLLAVLLCVGCLPALPEDAIFSSLHVAKKPGAETGPAVLLVGKKLKHISEHAFQAWPVMNGQNALVLAFEPKNRTGHYRLRYVEGESRQHRDLGPVPFTSADLIQVKQSDGSWAFVLSGGQGAARSIAVTDIDGITGLLEQASNPKVEADRLTYQNDLTGETRTAAISALLGRDMTAIYQDHENKTGRTEYAQFLPDRSAVLTDAAGQFHAGTWWTDGNDMHIRLKEGVEIPIRRGDLTMVDGVPAGTRLIVRLLQPLSSHKAKEGDPVRAVLISPASFDNKILLPQGCTFYGKITKAHGVGWAVHHETAALTVVFTSVKLPDGHRLNINTRLEQVENSQEKVNAQGAIQGIRSTGTLGHSAESKLASIAAFEPVAYLFTTVTATAALGFAEPEILYRAGTELAIRVESPVITSRVFPPTVPELAVSQPEQNRLEQFVHRLPFRTMTKGSNKPSDITNLAFIGSPEALRRAFQAAGWVATDQLTAASTFLTMKSVGGNQIYNEAPMSVLLLDERPPILTLTKTTNTFSSRHHVRVFDPALRYEGTTVLTASSTQDIGIGFSSKQKTFIHVIDQHIDNERSKIVNDLEFTGCVASAELVPRPWVPGDAYNSTGDKLQTDREIAVLQLTSCLMPKRSPSDNAVPPARLERITRDTMLTLKNDIWRGNLGYQGYSGVKYLHTYFAHKGELKPDTGAWQKTDLSGARFKGRGVEAAEQPSARGRSDERPAPPTDASVVAAEESHRWDPPRYEIGLQGGYVFFPNARIDGVTILLTPKDLFTNPNAGEIYGGAFADQADGGWSAGIYFIANTWKWFSNEFSYNYQRGKYQLEVFSFSSAEDIAQFESQAVGLVTRQFDYNLLFNMRPPRSRWRPYLALGPSLQLIALADTPLRKAPSAFKLGLQNVGALVAAFNFAGDPPLEGGGIFELGLQYGAGIQYRIHPRITLNADFRETWSKNSRFVTDSFTSDYFDQPSLVNYEDERGHYGPTSTFRQDRVTLGIAFSF
ncbi:MAG TPA: LssY C-terminal domain-containing protein [Bryobacteraceae bacterium]|nr:LssY C-terminal domain-containing protein [Bryobacteraceae bacterium]